MLEIDYIKNELIINGNNNKVNPKSLPSRMLLTIYGKNCYHRNSISVPSFTTNQVKNDTRYVYSYNQLSKSGVLKPYDNNNDNKYIIIVLESPSKNEFNYHFTPNVIANGKTGHQIEIYLNKLLDNIMNLKHTKADVTFNIRLVNSVRNQCDLHSVFQTPTKTIPLKKLIWFEMFTNQGERLFLESEIHNFNPVFIINACTRLNLGSTRGTLQQTVGTAIQSYKMANLLTFDEYRVYHPSVWDSKNIWSPFNNSSPGIFEW